MPVTYQYDAEKQAIYGAMTGSLTVEEYRSVGEEIVSSENHPPSVRSIWDLRGLDFSSVVREFLDELIHIRASFPERRSARLAFVVSDDLGFGMTRMFEILGEDLGDETMVFRDYIKAEEWLLLGLAGG